MHMNTGEHTSKCLHCGRTRRFRTAEAAAQAKPYGRICQMKIKAAALAKILKDFTASQIEQAREMIADGAFVALAHAKAFRVASSDGTAVYTTHPDGCNCPNSLRRAMPKPCKHMLGARILLAA